MGWPTEQNDILDAAALLSPSTFGPLVSLSLENEQRVLRRIEARTQGAPSWRAIALPDGRRGLRRIAPTSEPASGTRPAWRAVLLADGHRALRRMREHEQPTSPAPTPKAEGVPIPETGPAPAARRHASCSIAASTQAFRPLIVDCDRCGARVELRDWASAALCAMCRSLVLEAVTVYDRTNGIGAIPPNLLLRYGADLAVAA